MSDLMILLFVLYLTGCGFWLIFSLITWGVDRQYPSLYTDEEIAAKARHVLQTPVWPLTVLGMAGRTIANLQKDVMKP